MVFALLCNRSTFSCFNTDFFFFFFNSKKKRKKYASGLLLPNHSLTADHKEEAWGSSHRINTHSLLTQQGVKTFYKTSLFLIFFPFQMDSVAGI